MKYKGLIAGLLVSAFLVVNDNAIAQSKAIAANDAPPKNITASGVTIFEGHAGQAGTYSARHDALVIHLLQGNIEQEKYTAEQYAVMLGHMFKDPKRTDFPTDVVFFIDHSDQIMNSEKDIPTLAEVSINGIPIDWDGDIHEDGDSLILLRNLVGKIRSVTTKYAEKNGIASIGMQTNGASLALGN